MYPSFNEGGAYVLLSEARRVLGDDHVMPFWANQVARGLVMKIGGRPALRYNEMLRAGLIQ